MSNGYKEYIERLTEENKEYFNKIKSGFESDDLVITNDERDNIYSELLDDILCAQQDNRPLEVLFGNDINKFCKEYLNSLYPYNKLQKIFRNIIIYTLTMLIMAFGVAVINKSNGHIDRFMYGQFDMKYIIIGATSILISGVLFKIVKLKNTSKFKLNHKLIMWVISGFIAAILFEMIKISIYTTLSDVLSIVFSIIIISFVGAVIIDMLQKSHYKQSDSGLVKTINKLYKKKKDKYGWSQSQFITWYKKHITIWQTVLLVEFIAVVLVMPIVLLFATKGSYIIYRITGLAVIISIESIMLFIIITAWIRSRKLISKLVRGKIFLESYDGREESNYKTEE